ncbi:hypothetical protein J6590_038500 [Homalodisca vitripennis]|nr:hypothetical protein J6590_038500 [Homalodisca vitripennis]
MTNNDTQRVCAVDPLKPTPEPTPWPLWCGSSWVCCDPLECMTNNDTQRVCAVDPLKPTPEPTPWPLWV